MMDYLGPENLKRTRIFKPEGIQTMIDEHVGGRRDNGRPLWGLLNFMMWHELHIN